jgi:hypothetical protein
MGSFGAFAAKLACPQSQPTLKLGLFGRFSWKLPRRHNPFSPTSLLALAGERAAKVCPGYHWLRSAHFALLSPVRVCLCHVGSIRQRISRRFRRATRCLDDGSTASNCEVVIHGFVATKGIVTIPARSVCMIRHLHLIGKIRLRLGSKLV